MKKEIVFIDEDTLAPEELQSTEEDYELLKNNLIALGCWEEDGNEPTDE